MIREIILLAGMAIIFSGCGSSEKKENAADDVTIPPPLVKDSSGAIMESPKAEAKSEVKQENKKPIPVGSSAYEKAQQTLQEAVRSQNDEAIYRSGIQVLSLNSQDAKAQNAIGLYHYKKNRILAAEYFFSRALQQNPNVSELHNNMGLVHLAHGEGREAVKSFRKALELDQGNGAAAANLGAIYVEQKDYSKAFMALEIATKKNSKDFKSFVNFGIALAGVGKASQAKDQYLQAINLNGTSREGLYNLAVLEIEQLKKYQDGLDHLNKVKFLGVPDSARTHINALENKAKAGLK